MADRQILEVVQLHTSSAPTDTGRLDFRLLVYGFFGNASTPKGRTFLRLAAFGSAHEVARGTVISSDSAREARSVPTRDVLNEDIATIH